jgi:hypothetical protein
VYITAAPICVSLRRTVVAHLKYFLAICVTSTENYLLKSFANFFCHLSFIIIIIIIIIDFGNESSLYILNNGCQKFVCVLQMSASLCLPLSSHSIVFWLPSFLVKSHGSWRECLLWLIESSALCFWLTTVNIIFLSAVFFAFILLWIHWASCICDIFHHLWKFFIQYLFKYFSCPASSLSLLLPGLKIQILGIFPLLHHITCSLLFLVHNFCLSVFIWMLCIKLYFGLLNLSSVKPNSDLLISELILF